MTMSASLNSCGDIRYDRDFEVFFWREYTNSPGYVKPWFGDLPIRPMPERVAAILAEREDTEQ